MLVRLALDELDSVVDQVRVEVLDLLLAELDVVQAQRDLVVVQDTLLQTLLHELLKLFDLRERDLDGEQSTSGSRVGWLGRTYSNTR
jgi:hypothetical protein